MFQPTLIHVVFLNVVCFCAHMFDEGRDSSSSRGLRNAIEAFSTSSGEVESVSNGEYHYAYGI